MGAKSSKSGSAVAKPSMVVTSKSAVQQQKTEKAGQAIVKVLVGVANLTPLGKVITKAAITIADKTDHGAATAYLGKSNSTLDMVPGGNLAQAVASVATNGKSTSVLSKFDPKAVVVNQAKTEAKTTIAKVASTSTVSKVIRPSLAPALSPAVAKTITKRLVPPKR